MFYALKIVQLVSIVIDKHITSLNIINAIVNKCKLCWENDKLWKTKVVESALFVKHILKT
jgi:hypothetical protein